MMHVDVPIPLTLSSVRQPAPIASQCASKAPTGMGMLARSPSCSTQCGDNVPASVSEVAYSPSSFSRTPASRGSTFVQDCSGGNPPSEAFHNHLWPIAQMLRFTFFGSLTPQSVSATMSQCSNADANCGRFSGLCRSQRSSFEKPHSDEYTPPYHWMASSPSRCAASVAPGAASARYFGGGFCCCFFFPPRIPMICSTAFC